MRAGAFLLALAWFSASVYAGYRLTERSFAWIGDAEIPAPAAAPEETIVTDLKELTTMTPAQLQEEAKKLSPAQMLCLRASIAPDRVSAALSGALTPEEAAAVRKCLE
jgi:hypothetical protein